MVSGCSKHRPSNEHLDCQLVLYGAQSKGRSGAFVQALLLSSGKVVQRKKPAIERLRLNEDREAGSEVHWCPGAIKSFRSSVLKISEIWIDFDRFCRSVEQIGISSC